MAEKQTENGKERYIFPYPLCEARKTSIGRLSEHLKNFHRPLAELESSKRDDRSRISPKQKEMLSKAMRENRYKSMEQKYSIIMNIVTPGYPMVANNVLPPPGEEDLKSPTPAPEPRNLQQHFRSETENILDIMMTLSGGEIEGFVQYYEGMALILRNIIAGGVEGATSSESPYHPAPTLTLSQPAPAYPALRSDPPIAGLVAYETPFYSPSSSNQNFMAPSSAIEWQSLEWLDFEEQD